MADRADGERERAAPLDAGHSDGFEQTAFDDLARMAAEVFDSPVAAISILNREGHQFYSTVGHGGANPLPMELLEEALRDPHHPLVVEDLATDPRFSAISAFVDGQRMRFYVAAPLPAPHGYAVGVISVADLRPHSVRADQLETLDFLAAQVIRKLAERRSGPKAPAVSGGSAAADS